MSLDASITPALCTDKDGKDLPIDTITGTDKTAYLKINLEIAPMGGQPAEPMTAVFVPDPKQLKTSDVPVLLWLHGDKKFWSRKRGGSKDRWGLTVRDYLKEVECTLREFILKTSARKFLMVVPTLNDHTGRSSGPCENPGGLLWYQAQAEAYLKQVLNGVRKHLGINVSGPGNLVLAAHSGGGHLLGRMAQYFTGPFDRVNEVWCFDCTYWGGTPFKEWAKRGHSNPRLFVYSTGGKGPKQTGDFAWDILQFSKTKEAALTNTDIAVLIDNYPAVGKPSNTKFFGCDYGASANGHYESIEMYLKTLIDASKNLDPKN